MARVEFVVDDFKAAEGFVRSLPKTVRELRFDLDRKTGLPRKWTPTHLVIARVNGRSVAMADALFSEIGSAANGSLVALSGFGAYAVRSLLTLKRQFYAEHWEATLRYPTDATVAIARKFFDVAYDQGAWEISQELMTRHGADGRLVPYPLMTSNSTLATFGIPSLRSIDPGSLRQLLVTSRSPMEAVLTAPNGDVLPHPVVVGLVFDLLDIPMKVRQHLSRMFLLMASVAFGHSPDPDAAMQIMDPKSFSEYLRRIEGRLEALPRLPGMFSETPAPPIDLTRVAGSLSAAGGLLSRSA
ncbi:hypothetical protein [Rhizobium sp. LjRoot258]|uniref:hypothetical protein n=1 Tax=Rhizobium sp. LjRoot258 TaxID=3342299 RepID=UPI003ECEEBF5